MHTEVGKRKINSMMKAKQNVIFHIQHQNFLNEDEFLGAMKLKGYFFKFQRAGTSFLNCNLQLRIFWKENCFENFTNDRNKIEFQACKRNDVVFTSEKRFSIFNGFLVAKV